MGLVQKGGRGERNTRGQHPPDVSPETFVRKADLASRASAALRETAEQGDLPSRANAALRETAELSDFPSWPTRPSGRPPC